MKCRAVLSTCFQRWVISIYRQSSRFNEKTESSASASIGVLLAALKACLVTRDLQAGKKVHSDASYAGHASDVFIATTLINMYAKCGSTVDARAVFDSMPQDVVSTTAMILGHVENGENVRALELFSGIVVRPDARAFVAALRASAGLAAGEDGQTIGGKMVKRDSLEKGMAVHHQATEAGDDTHIFVATTLIDMYSKCGSLLDARKVFDKMATYDVVAWNSLLMGCVENRESELALALLSSMEDLSLAPDARTFVASLGACAILAECEAASEVNGQLLKVASLERGNALHSRAVDCGLDLDIFVANTLVDMYAKCGSMARARSVFDKLWHRDVVSWTALILGYAENGDAEVALELYSRMRRDGCEPDSKTLVAALVACGNLVALDAGRRIHDDARRLELHSNVLVGNALVDFYATCGSMEAAEEAFSSITRKDTISWNSLVTGYSKQGDAEKVLSLFQRMQEGGGERIKPNSITFLSVLSACGHCGLVDKGREIFQAMAKQHGVEPGMEHFHCVIDMLGRGGHLEQALETIEAMPWAADATTWTIVLSSCRKWKNARIGRVAFDRLMELDGGKESSTYLLMAGIYASAGMRAEKEEVLQLARHVSGDVDVITDTT
ncbi:pentatricopeptide repeat-containing protein At1g11290, chloroplastic-like [Selaginella moellendorffii]|uniref:pentatricopeptide repeat-containing protein At1g11290, chloroplastic-like n=1 Tax=Selaginella moellendorffii TaxID=88036 RepID=UPI000D1C76E6|nr:pentatricopeptide repeat-containing protein At1g11290, chloroplastic-like [Selaginella moellendorffii]|eukprot:XP_024536948.1 pentatricopeptide repeat-containing protein At1g11290, chloroplastic-like [Selaginella moellendorffii]